MRTKVIPSWDDYKATGLNPEQIKQMYENLTEAYDLILRLIDGEVSVMKLAVEESVSWLNSNVKYAKREIH